MLNFGNTVSPACDEKGFRSHRLSWPRRRCGPVRSEFRRRCGGCPLDWLGFRRQWDIFAAM